MNPNSVIVLGLRKRFSVFCGVAVGVSEHCEGYVIKLNIGESIKPNLEPFSDAELSIIIYF